MLQVVPVHQNEMHSRGGSCEHEEGLGGSGGTCGSITTGDNNPLFLELGSEDRAAARSETMGLEIPSTEATELREALWVQTATLQVQVCIKEQMHAQMEQLSISLNQQHSSQQELLEALHVTAWGFGHGLGSGLDAWARIAMGQEEWSNGEEDKE